MGVMTAKRVTEDRSDTSSGHLIRILPTRLIRLISPTCFAKQANRSVSFTTPTYSESFREIPGCRCYEKPGSTPRPLPFHGGGKCLSARSPFLDRACTGLCCAPPLRAVSIELQRNCVVDSDWTSAH